MNSDTLHRRYSDIHRRKMPGALGRNLHLCFSKIKRPLAPQCPPNPQSPQDHNRPFPAAAAASSSILIKNFNTLYDDTTTAAAATTPDFATIFASHRFFFSSPGLSNSIIESAPSMAADSSTPSESDNTALVTNSVAVSTYSPDPYMDFRKSMQEMVEARDQCTDVKANWDYLHELLLCYLALNPKSTHKFIVGAFADVLVSLMSPPPRSGGQEGEFAAGGIKISRQW